MLLILGAFLLGLVSGLRSMTGAAVVSWAARTGRLALAGSWLAFASNPWLCWLLSLLAVGELIADKLPFIPSRKSPVPFLSRIIMGTLCGLAIGISAGNPIIGALSAAIGAIAGTLGGYAARVRITQALNGRGLPVALCEDLIAIGTACAVLFART